MNRRDWRNEKSVLRTRTVSEQGYDGKVTLCASSLVSVNVKGVGGGCVWIDGGKNIKTLL